MKNFIASIILILISFAAFSQTDAGNDTTKYIWYKYQYGSRMARFMADSVMSIPKDTIYSKQGIARKGRILYEGDGIRWTAVAIAVPNDIIYTIPSGNIVDTLFTDPFGNINTTYTWVSCPEFIGLRVRVSWPGFGFLMTDDTGGTGWWCHYDTVSGILKIYSANGPNPGGFVTMSAY